MREDRNREKDGFLRDKYLLSCGRVVCVHSLMDGLDGLCIRASML